MNNELFTVVFLEAAEYGQFHITTNVDKLKEEHAISYNEYCSDGCDSKMEGKDFVEYYRKDFKTLIEAEGHKTFMENKFDKNIYPVYNVRYCGLRDYVRELNSIPDGNRKKTTNDFINLIPTIIINDKTWYNLSYIESTRQEHNLDFYIQTYPHLRSIGHFDSIDNPNFETESYNIMCQQIEKREFDRRRKDITLTFEQYFRIYRPSNIIKIGNNYYGDFYVMSSYQSFVNVLYELYMIQELTEHRPNFLQETMSTIKNLKL